MKKKPLLFSVTLLFIVSLLFYNLSLDNNKDILKEEIYEEKYKEKLKYAPADETANKESFNPSQLKGKALADYNKWREELRASGNKFTDYNTKRTNKKRSYFSDLPAYSYANNRITGSWSQKYVQNIWKDIGHDAHGSVYDPVNEELYVVSNPGHIYKIDESKDVIWSLRNHKRNFKGLDLNGINLPDKSFRLINQQPNGGMEYSDDEGRTWTTANGALFQNALNFNTHIVKTPVGRRVVAHGGNFEGNSGFDKLFISDDYGLNYRASRFKFARNLYEVKTVKPHNDNSVYAYVRNKTNSKIFIFKLNPNETDFSLVIQPEQELPTLGAVHGTLVDGNYHFYISSQNKIINYSNDGGQTWTLITSNNNRNLAGIHPTKPNICFRGFTDLFISEDYGATFNGNRNNLGTYYIWDLMHMRTYDKEDGGNFSFIGTHFGSYYSETDPSDRDTWKSVNRGSPNILAYDAVTSEKHNKIFTVNQDRGGSSFIDLKDDRGLYNLKDEASTDIFRVALAKNEESVWFWYYYGAIGRKAITDSRGQNGVTRGYFYGNWWATSMVASPKEWEDAVYIPSGQTQLDRILYTGSRLVKASHPYVFPGSATSFNYSSLNRQRWYVGLKTGEFFYSTDGGVTFTETSYSGTMPGQTDSWVKQRQVIVASPIDEATVYYTGRGNTFLISTDGGVTFKNHNNGLDVGGISDFTISPDGKFIFAACDWSGAWVYATEEDQWFKMGGDDVPLVRFYDAQYIKSKDIVRFSTYGSGILDFKLDVTSLSINDNLLDNLSKARAYPNPTSNQFEINISSSRIDVLVHVYSITGKLVSNKKHKVVDGKIQLNIENESSGIYFTKIFLEKPIMVKVVKK